MKNQKATSEDLPLLRVEEIAAILKTSPWLIEAAIIKGELKAQKRFNTFFVTNKDLLAYILTSKT